MSEQNNSNIENTQENEYTLKDLFEQIRGNWVWFVASIITCLLVASFYLKVTHSEYMRSATVLIKDEKKGGAGATESAIFSEMGIMGGKSNVDNEMIVFKSNKLTHDVVKSLNLNINYIKPGYLKDKDLYGISPISVSFIDNSEVQSSSFSVIIEDSLNVTIKSFVIGDEKFAYSQKIAFADTVSTPSGRIVVDKTLYFSSEDYHDEIQVKHNRLKNVVTRYQNAISVSLSSKTSSALEISMKDICPKRAEDVINTLISIYNEDAINDKNQVAQSTQKFIDDRLQIIGKDLTKVDTQIEQYKQNNEITDISSEMNVTLTAGSDYKKQALSVDNEIYIARFIRDYLTDPRKSKELIPANTGIQDTSINELISQYNTKKIERDRLLANSGMKNPLVQDLNNELAALNQSIISSIDNLLASLKIKQKGLSAQEDKTKRRIASVPSQEKQVASISRDQKIKEELYLYLLNKREENAMTLAITENCARVIDEAHGSDIPVAPRKMMILFVALIIGCVIPLGVFYLIEIMNTTVRGRKDVEDVVTAPFLGEIPEKEKSEDEEVVVGEGKRDSISEAFRILRTNMDFVSMHSGFRKVITFTSYSPGSGKTFISTNFAITLAMGGKKVALIDMDLRKRTLSQRHKNGRALGVSTYLSGQINDISEIIFPSNLHENLDMVYAGPMPPNPAELLMSNKLDEMINALKDKYDYILIDSVPNFIVADAGIINRVSNITMFVLRVGLIDRRLLPIVEKLYKNQTLNNMCIVLNGIKVSKTGYGYGYGYGNESDKKKKNYLSFLDKIKK